MKENLLNVNKTKYRYLMDNIELKGTAIIYTIPVDKKPAVIDGELNRDYPSVKISYKKLVKMIDKTAKALLAYGVKKGDIVVICSSNVPETIYMDYALNKIGGIPSYIYPNITPDEMNYYIKEVDAKYVYMLDTPEIRANIVKALNGTKVEKIISSSVLESFPVLFKKIANNKTNEKEKVYCDKFVSWSEFIKCGDTFDGIEENEYIPNDLCSLVHTSGTSSTPKAVMESNENINAIVKNYEIHPINFSTTKILLNTIPVFVEFGKTVTHAALCNNLQLLIIPEMNPKNLPSLIQKFKPNYFEATPSHCREMIISKTINDLSFLDIAGVGGDGFDSIEKELNLYLKRLGSPSVGMNGYGSTEISAAGITNSVNENRFGSIGKALGDTCVGLFVPDTFEKIDKPNVIGELAITGDTVTLGYYKKKEETEKVYQKHPDGKVWVHMGDLAYFDEDGFYFYEGRIKNIIARRSFKFAPKEIEDAILLHKSVKQCVVIGKYDKEDGQVPSAHIVLNDDSNIEKNVDEIIELVNSKVQEFHRPVVYKFKPSIIITRNNKVNINALKIEDIATIPDDINDAVISLSEDAEYDYELKLYCDNKVDEQGVIDFIEQTAKNEKVLNGKIKYNFIIEKGNNYFRYVQ